MKKTLRDRLEGSVAAKLWASGKMLLQSCVYVRNITISKLNFTLSSYGPLFSVFISNSSSLLIFNLWQEDCKNVAYNSVAYNSSNTILRHVYGFIRVWKLQCCLGSEHQWMLLLWGIRTLRRVPVKCWWLIWASSLRSYLFFFNSLGKHNGCG